MILHLSASAHGKTQQTTRVGYMMHNIAPRQSSAFMGEDHTPQDRSTNHVSYCGVLLSLLALATSRPVSNKETLEWRMSESGTGILPQASHHGSMGAHHGLPPPFLVSGWRNGQPGQTWMESVTARKGTSMRGPRCLLTARCAWWLSADGPRETVNLNRKLQTRIWFY